MCYLVLIAFSLISSSSSRRVINPVLASLSLLDLNPFSQLQSNTWITCNVSPCWHWGHPSEKDAASRNPEPPSPGLMGALWDKLWIPTTRCFYSKWGDGAWTGSWFGSGGQPGNVLGLPTKWRMERPRASSCKVRGLGWAKDTVEFGETQRGGVSG